VRPSALTAETIAAAKRARTRRLRGLRALARQRPLTEFEAAALRDHKRDPDEVFAEALEHHKRNFARRRAELESKRKLTIRERLDLDSLAGSDDEVLTRAVHTAARHATHALRVAREAIPDEVLRAMVARARQRAPRPRAPRGRCVARRAIVTARHARRGPPTAEADDPDPPSTRPSVAEAA
jgi:hypothetical protein